MFSPESGVRGRRCWGRQTRRLGQAETELATRSRDEDGTDSADEKIASSNEQGPYATLSIIFTPLSSSHTDDFWLGSGERETPKYENEMRKGA